MTEPHDAAGAGLKILITNAEHEAAPAPPPMRVGLRVLRSGSLLDDSHPQLHPTAAKPPLAQRSPLLSVPFVPVNASSTWKRVANSKPYRLFAALLSPLYLILIVSMKL